MYESIKRHLINQINQCGQCLLMQSLSSWAEALLCPIKDCLQQMPKNWKKVQIWCLFFNLGRISPKWESDQHFPLDASLIHEVQNLALGMVWTSRLVANCLRRQSEWDLREKDERDFRFAHLRENPTITVISLGGMRSVDFLYSNQWINDAAKLISQLLFTIWLFTSQIFYGIY